MTISVWWLFAAVWIGVAIGVVISALLAASAAGDARGPRLTRARSAPGFGATGRS